MDTRVHVKGRVVSGVGRGRWFLGLDWVATQIRETLGFDAYQGTLNVQLDTEASHIVHAFTMPRPGIPITSGDSAFVSGKAFKIRLNERVDGALVIPLIPHYPPNQLEIIAPLHLRNALGLLDGDEVTVEIYDN